MQIGLCLKVWPGSFQIKRYHTITCSTCLDLVCFVFPDIPSKPIGFHILEMAYSDQRHYTGKTAAFMNSCHRNQCLQPFVCKYCPYNKIFNDFDQFEIHLRKCGGRRRRVGTKRRRSTTRRGNDRQYKCKYLYMDSIPSRKTSQTISGGSSFSTGGGPKK